MDPGTPQENAAASFKASLPPALKKTLAEFWGSETILDEPGILAELGPDTLGRVQRIGRISLGNIARGLELFGYIESSRRWLIEGKKRAGSADP
jgi:hypothetical protein